MKRVVRRSARILRRGESRQHVPLFLWSVTAARPRREVSIISLLSGFLCFLDH